MRNAAARIAYFIYLNPQMQMLVEVSVARWVS
jgi:hypothetical protein